MWIVNPKLVFVKVDPELNCALRGYPFHGVRRRIVQQPKPFNEITQWAGRSPTAVLHGSADRIENHSGMLSKRVCHSEHTNIPKFLSENRVKTKLTLSMIGWSWNVFCEILQRAKFISDMCWCSCRNPPFGNRLVLCKLYRLPSEVTRLQGRPNSFHTFDQVFQIR